MRKSRDVPTVLAFGHQLSAEVPEAGGDRNGRIEGLEGEQSLVGETVCVLLDCDPTDLVVLVPDRIREQTIIFANLWDEEDDFGELRHFVVASFSELFSFGFVVDGLRNVLFTEGYVFLPSLESADDHDWSFLFCLKKNRLLVEDDGANWSLDLGHLLDDVETGDIDVLRNKRKTVTGCS